MTAYSLASIGNPQTKRATGDAGADVTLRGFPSQHPRCRDALSPDRAPASEAFTDVVVGPRLEGPTSSAASAAHPRREPVKESTCSEPGLGAVAGPSAGLRALPQPIAGQLTTLEGVDDHLARLEAARQAQLNALPATPSNVVAAAHRGTVAWILEQVRAARQRLREGVYGICARCGSLIDPDRLNMRPWLITCTECAPSDRPVLPVTGR